MQGDDDVQSSVPNPSTDALPVVIDSSSDSPTNSDVEAMSDESESMLNYPYGGQIEDVDISFASSCEPTSPQRSQQGKCTP